MARKKRFSIDDIIGAAFEIVRVEGMANLTARAVGRALNASTMPVYSHVKAMREIEEAVVRRAWETLAVYQATSRSGDIYVDIGLGYVLFAKNEPHLFACIHSDAYRDINTALGDINFENHLNRLLEADYPMFRGLPAESVRVIMFYGWLFTHGFASLLTSGIGNEVRKLESEAATIAFFNSATAIFYEGLKSLVKTHQP